MNGRGRIARGIGTIVVTAVLLVVLALAWDLRPALPPLPQSFSAPLPSGMIGATLGFVAWVVFVLLDLVLIGRVLQFAIWRDPTRSELRLRRAFAHHERFSIDETRDWRAHAAPLAPPVLRLPARRESAEREPTAPPLPQPGPHDVSAPADVVATDAGSERIGVLLLGPLELIGCKKKQPRRQATAELISYLAIQRRSAGRDELLEALWPGDDLRRSAARFYQAASEARKLLGDSFHRERDTYRLDNVHTDLAELEQLREQAIATAGNEQRALLERMFALFRGEPLAGIEALWADSEQRRLTAVRADLLERAGRVRLESGDAAGALALAEEATAADPSNERPVQLAIEAEAALGRREAVVERYERLRRNLDDQFGLEPSRDTKMLYRRLLGQDASIAT